MSEFSHDSLPKMISGLYLSIITSTSAILFLTLRQFTTRHVNDLRLVDLKTRFDTLINRWGLSHDYILGSDFLQHFQCQIHYDSGTFVVGNTEIPIRYCKVTPSVCRIFLCGDIQVEPGTEQVIEAKLEGEFEHNTGTPGILEESRERRGKSEITIARSLSPGMD